MDKINLIFDYFDELFPNPKCALNFSNPFELVVAVVLSAQCTDERVNQVTKTLFKLANSPIKMLSLGENEIKRIIYPCGFYNNKSKSIISLSQKLIDQFNGEVPSTMEELTSLPGVGRKTANVVLSIAFDKPAIAVDTHVHRVSKRLELTTKNSTPEKCEQDLLKIVPIEKQSKFHHQTIWFGRTICKAQRPNCNNCQLNKICKYSKKEISK
jgi:endonuclease-3